MKVEYNELFCKESFISMRILSSLMAKATSQKVVLSILYPVWLMISFSYYSQKRDKVKK